jgi:SAM-dependent methyltransferase
LLGDGAGRAILDLGAGNGIASYSLARVGWKVTAVEPGPSAEVGAEAIRSLSQEAGLTITVVEEWGEALPFADNCFSAVFGRQVLHHARNLDAMVSEIARVLMVEGTCLFVREHVADDTDQRADFLANHPLSAVFDDENAFSLTEYHSAFANAGLRLQHEWGRLESILNFYPGSEAQRRLIARDHARGSKRAGRFLAWSRRFQARKLAHAARHDRTPGRMYSFLLAKPATDQGNANRSAKRS